MPIDPRSLSSFRNAQIEGDVACVKCGYNLKGLPRGGNCPECGSSVASSFGRGRFLFKNLTDAPMSYLKMLRMGFYLIAGCIAALFLSIVMAVKFGGLSASLLVAAIGIVWWGGVFLVTSSEHPPGELSDRYDRLKWLRRINRTLQAAWAIAWGLAAMQVLLSARQNALIATGATGAGLDDYIRLTGVGSVVMQLVGLVSLIPLCIHFAEIGTAAGNDSLATRLGLAAWGLMLFGGYLTVMFMLSGFGGFGGFLGFGSPLAGLGMLVSIGLFVFSLLELAVMCGWAVANSRAAIARDLRLLQRAQAEEARAQARLAELPPLDIFQKPRDSELEDTAIPLEPER